MKGRVSTNIISMFLALIQKVDHPNPFNDFHFISLCTMVYTIILKIIVFLLKPILSRVMSNEQFGFLAGRNIHEAVGTTQEVLVRAGLIKLPFNFQHNNESQEISIIKHIRLQIYQL